MKLKITFFVYKWLPIVFGCHGRLDRSFVFHNRKFPICARCTGELAGIILSILVFQFVEMPSVFASVLIMIPMVVDGFVQALTSYESKNWKRLVTGILFGIGFSVVVARFTMYFHHLGWMIGYQMRS